MWTYGIELWGCASKFNIALIQRYRSKILRNISNAPWYVLKHPSFRLLVPYVDTVSRERKSYSSRRPGLASLPPHGTANAPAKRQAIEKKTDI